MHRPAAEIFACALEFEGEARAAFLAEACGDDVALRREVNAMLADAGPADHFFGDEDDEPDDMGEPVFEQVGDVFGPYTLPEQIGEGGFGVVWMAGQSQPIGRKVALKVIKAGMDTKQVLARFEAERQALAMMDHPNIARVLDAGATPAGRPYFAMELVKGIPITEFCDQEKLDTRQRLELFCNVCSAVAHAHQKGVIHRDLKPSNVMVSLNGDRGVPKVIDFGIAKATDQKLTDQTLFTRFGQFFGTPVYMSPEQAAMGAADIDTRSDIYSLGMLLYELLAGRPAFDSKTLLSVGYEEMRRIIREDEPPKPSVRMTQTQAASRSHHTSHTNHTNPPNHSPHTNHTNHTNHNITPHALRGDLDWIVMKALEKDRTRRYDTANGLAADIQRHLANEPVLARPASAAYRFQKAIRRNKLAFAAAMALFVGAIVSTWQAVEANKARLAAQTERDSKAAALKEAEAISAFLTDVLQSANPAPLSSLLTNELQSSPPQRNSASITVADILGNAARKLETDLAGQPARRAKLQAILGRTYLALGLIPDAIPLQEKVRDYYRTTSGPEHPDTLNAMKDLAWCYWEAGRLDEALPLREEVLTLSRKVLGPEHPDTIKAMGSLTRSYSTDGRYAESRKLNEEALALSRKVLGPEHPVTPRVMNFVGESYTRTGHPEEAIEMQKEALALHRKLLGPEHPDTLGALQFLDRSYGDAFRFDEAITVTDELVVLCRKVLGPQHPYTLQAMEDQASLYRLAGRKDEALKLSREVVTLTQQVFGKEFHDTLWAMAELANSCDETGRADEALKLREQSVPLWHKTLGPESRKTLNAMMDLAGSYSRAGRKDEAFKLRDEMIKWRKQTLALRTAAFPTIRATLLAPDAEWKWLHPTDGNDPANALPGFHKAFPLPGFDDSQWTPGRDKGGPFGGFGYSDVFDGVDIGKPENPAHRHTAYFRHAFTTDTEHGHLELRCQDYDDGIIAYLDGKEVLRDNVMPRDEAYLLRSIEAAGAENEGSVHRFPIPGTLAPGPHTLAISVHNTARDSSDLYIGGVTLVEVEPAAERR